MLRCTMLCLGVVVPLCAQDGRPVYFVRDVAPILDQEGAAPGPATASSAGGRAGSSSR
ncbi:MAG: hypothetical protein M5U09_05355 [Gammaproteobacteria bacterium]|nr:hypothetical protein [Gammaproteobacteria bacterium]